MFNKNRKKYSEQNTVIKYTATAMSLISCLSQTLDDVKQLNVFFFLVPVAPINATTNSKGLKCKFHQVHSEKQILNWYTLIKYLFECYKCK